MPLKVRYNTACKHYNDLQYLFRQNIKPRGALKCYRKEYSSALQYSFLQQQHQTNLKVS